MCIAQGPATRSSSVRSGMWGCPHPQSYMSLLTELDQTLLAVRYYNHDAPNGASRGPEGVKEPRLKPGILCGRLDKP